MALWWGICACMWACTLPFHGWLGIKCLDMFVVCYLVKVCFKMWEPVVYTERQHVYVHLCAAKSFTCICCMFGKNRKQDFAIGTVALHMCLSVFYHCCGDMNVFMWFRCRLACRAAWPYKNMRCVIMSCVATTVSLAINQALANKWTPAGLFGCNLTECQ